MGTSSLLRYWHTLRHLRPVQIYGRFWFRLYHPRPSRRPAPLLRPATGPWLIPLAGESRLLGPSTFHFLNQTRTLTDPGDWNAADVDKLWLYNLHYFDDLNATGAEERQDWHHTLINRWIIENPPGQGTGWEPYPLSLRIVNWIKWALVGHRLEESWLHSLAVQVRFLRQRLEYHLLGNHLLVNAKALVFAGLFFQGREANEWLSTGLKLLHRELPEQILADGGHFERSPMYHALILEDWLDLLNLARAYGDTLPEQMLIADQRDVVERMRGWLQALCHPDGEISFFNDAAMGVAAPPAALQSYAERLGAEPIPPAAEGITPLSTSGYLRLQQARAVVLLDVAPVGPDYLPGHAHADTLSFEWSLDGQRVLVNSGTSCYGVSYERARQRATAAHNTVVVNGENSSEVWGGFRVARRAQPFGLTQEVIDSVLEVRCSHDGYRRLAGSPVHQRLWRLQANALIIQDRIMGRCREAVAYFHLHPAVNLEWKDAQSGLLRLAGGQTIGWQVDHGRCQVQPSTYHPRFGVSEVNQCLVVHFAGAETKISFDWD